MISAPTNTVMLFDSIPGKNLIGGRELLPHPPRHSAGQTVGFLDGHAKQFTTDHLADFLWRPQSEKRPDTPQKSQGN